MARALCIAALRAVLPGRREDERREELVDARERAAADERHGAAARVLEPAEKNDLRLAGIDRFGRVGDLEQRAVEVEEERPVTLEWGHLFQSAPERRRAARARAITRLRWRMRAASISMRPAQR